VSILNRLRGSATELKVLEAGELAEVAARLAAESEDHASVIYDDPTDRVIAAFEGPIFAILSPDLVHQRLEAAASGETS